MTKTINDCLFCRIVRSEISVSLLAETEFALAFEDKFPEAPLHALIIPKKHIETVADVSNEHIPYMSLLTEMANDLARKKNVDQTGYRLVVNCRSNAGQSVYHLHMHLLAGRTMTWPPG